MSKTLVQVRLSDQAMEMLAEIEEITGISNRTSQIEQAIRVYKLVAKEHYAAQQHGKWASLVSVESDGSEKRTMLTGL